MALARSASRSIGRARRLRLLDHARDLRQNGGFAQRLGAAHHGAVVVERAGQHAVAWLAGERSGFAGQHRLVDAGAAFDDGGVDREAFAGQDQHVVAGANLIQRAQAVSTPSTMRRAFTGRRRLRESSAARARRLARPSSALPSSRKPRISRTAS